MFLSSCNSNATLIPTSAPVATETNLSTATFTPTPINTVIPTKTSVYKLTYTPQPNNKPGLIVTLGEVVPPYGIPGIPVFSPDGQIIALASSKIQFWDVNTYQLVRELKNPYSESCYVSNAKFSPDGKLFAISATGCHKGDTSVGHLLVWDINTGELLQEWTQEYAKMPPPRSMSDEYEIPVYAMSFLPNSTTIVFASGNTLEIRDVINNENHDVLKLGPKMYASQVSLSSDGRLAYIIMSWEKDQDFPSSWTYQHKFQVWNINTHAMLREVKYPEGWMNLSLELLGTSLVQVDFEKNTSQILDLETNKVRDLPFRMGWRYYNADGSLMIYARLFGFNAKEQGIELWNTDSWRNIYTFMPVFGQEIDEIAFSPDNTILAITHDKELISLWNVRLINEP